MSNNIKFIFLLFIVISCNSKCNETEESVSDFIYGSDVYVEQKISSLGMKVAINSDRYRRYYTDFTNYYEQSISLRNKFINHLDFNKEVDLFSVKHEYDTLVEIITKIYSPLIDTSIVTSYGKDSETTHFETQITRLDYLLNPLNSKIINWSKPLDSQIILMMLSKIDSEVIDFLIHKAETGLFNCTGYDRPIMIEKKDFYEFYLTAIDSTSRPYLLIGTFEAENSGWGEIYNSIVVIPFLTSK